MKITIVKACSDLGVHVNGSQDGPKVLNKFDNIVDKTITINKQDVKKELEKDNKKKNIKYINEFNTKLYNEIINDNNFIITIGGDHSIAIGSDLASAKKHNNIGIMWIDAHSDYHNMDSTISGNIHGMPLCEITGKNKNELSVFHTTDYINPKYAVIIGARDIEAPELINLQKAGVTVFTTEDIKQKGVNTIMQEAYDILKNTDGVHISYDLDVIDPQVAPGVSVPAANGINEEEAYQIMDEVLKHKDIINSMDLVEYNSLRDKEDKTYKIAKKLRDKIINNI